MSDNNAAFGDRVRLDYTSDVSQANRELILDAICYVAVKQGLYIYQHYDTATSAWSIDITAHDRSLKRDMTDGQIIGYLESIAEEKGLSVSALLRAAKEGL